MKNKIVQFDLNKNSNSIALVSDPFIHEYTSIFNNVKIEIDIENNIFIPRKRYSVYRLIMRELIANACEGFDGSYKKASTVELKMFMHDNMLRIIIKDNGPGFHDWAFEHIQEVIEENDNYGDVSPTKERHGGYGLWNIYEKLMERKNGSFIHITSTRNYNKMETVFFDFDNLQVLDKPASQTGSVVEIGLNLAE